MRGEKGISSGNVASFEDFKNRREVVPRRSTSVSEMRYRGPYGYGGVPTAKAVPNSSTDAAKIGNPPEPQTRAEFLNAMNERQLRQARLSKTSDLKILRFPTNPDSVEPTK